jgi:hypothetical protein
MFFVLPRIYLNEITKQIRKDTERQKKWCKENFQKYIRIHQRICVSIRI